jgi:hypothetical protein
LFTTIAEKFSISVHPVVCKLLGCFNIDGALYLRKAAPLANEQSHGRF